MIVVDSVLQTPRGAFGVRVAEPAEHPAGTILCVHGFPDDATTFDRLAAGLAERGHRVISVYLRGYHPSPTSGRLGFGDLVADLAGLAQAASPGTPVSFVGHDYGAQLGYALLARHAELVRAAVLIAGAHPDAIAANTRRHPRQLWMSRYIVGFQFGAVADRAVARHGFAALDRLWDRWSPTSVPDPEHRERVRRTIERSMPAPIAMYRGGGFAIGDARIPVPTLVIAGDADGCSLPEMTDGQDRFFSSSYRREVWHGSGHYPHLDDPQRTEIAVSNWFARHGAA